jgi:hypothetical protein
MSISASLNWPVALNNECFLQLVIEGTVLRVEGGLSVMSVARYEFRTSGRVDAPARAEIEALRRRLGGLFGGSDSISRHVGRV